MSDEASLQAIEEELRRFESRSALFTRPGFLIRRLHQIHTWLFLQETAQFSITPVQYSLLTALAERGEIDQNTLALEIGLERTTVAEVIPRLQDKGLLERRQSEHDRRVKQVRLTRKGRNLLVRMGPAAQRAHDRTIEFLSDHDQRLFMLQLARLVDANNELSAAPLKLG